MYITKSYCQQFYCSIVVAVEKWNQWTQSLLVLACVFCDCLLFSEHNAEREFLINNVGVELLPLFLSVSPSLIAGSKYL